ncbi:hypothetical protein VNO78_34983 [Psophocarpus tetragonolobus]|uniref:Uncharacterized protein n=1 Tax=Psophocarpus tetragonolobus TaxID=3891 RepID=A0AAN9RLJ9_PSOTE
MTIKLGFLSVGLGYETETETGVANRRFWAFADTVRRLVWEGIPSNHAEAITKFLSVIEMMEEANLSNYKVEFESKQNHHFSLSQHEIEKLRSDVEKICTKNDINMRGMMKTIKYDVTKYCIGADVTKYCIGAVLSIAALGTAGRIVS